MEPDGYWLLWSNAAVHHGHHRVLEEIAQSGGKITFSCGATRVPEILKRLSAKTGTELRATPALAHARHWPIPISLFV